MTQKKETVEKIAELNTLFMTLDDKAQDSALTVLRALEFAQSVMCTPNPGKEPGAGPQHSTV